METKSKNLKKVAFLNTAGWAWKNTTERWAHRLGKTCSYIKNIAPEADYIGLAEVILGKRLKYLTLLKREFPDYQAILPVGYREENEKHYKSAVNVLLVKKQQGMKIECRTLDGVGRKGRFLYNYVILEKPAADGRAERLAILNVHVPHTDNDSMATWYQKERVELREQFEEAILKEARLQSEEEKTLFVLIGDLNCTTDSKLYTELCQNSRKAENIENTEIQEPVVAPKNADEMQHSLCIDPLAYEDSGKGTWFPAKKRIDYILYGGGRLKKEAKETIPPTHILVEPVYRMLSDHALITGEFAL